MEGLFLGLGDGLARKRDKEKILGEVEKEKVEKEKVEKGVPEIDSVSEEGEVVPADRLHSSSSSSTTDSSELIPFSSFFPPERAERSDDDKTDNTKIKESTYNKNKTLNPKLVLEPIKVHLGLKVDLRTIGTEVAKMPKGLLGLILAPKWLLH
jgi:hypothetical protein